MEMQVIDVRALRTRRERQITDLEALIEQRRRNVRMTERYIRLFGRCFSNEKLTRLQAHAADVHASIFEMADDLEHLKYQPLY